MRVKKKGKRQKGGRKCSRGRESDSLDDLGLLIIYTSIIFCHRGDAYGFWVKTRSDLLKSISIPTSITFDAL